MRRATIRREDELYSLFAASRAYRVPRSRILLAMIDGELPVVKVGERRLLTRRDLDRVFAPRNSS
jgi:hypothetical protein